MLLRRCHTARPTAACTRRLGSSGGCGGDRHDTGDDLLEHAVGGGTRGARSGGLVLHHKGGQLGGDECAAGLAQGHDLALEDAGGDGGEEDVAVRALAHVRDDKLHRKDGGDEDDGGGDTAGGAVVRA